ncbi:MAG: Phage head-tail joining protein [Candidatus Midichloriaceae bacterium]|jgi:SPP1 family predicted phage head-tail adaptor|nr:Phage head-tail joining protein [Candidatus Midichloriaceae bacterium]
MNLFNKLNKIVTVQSPKFIPDNFGGQKVIWQDFLKTWASVEQINNLSPQIRSHNFSKNFYKFIMRAQHKITHKMRIMLDEEAFNVEAVNPNKSSNSYIDVITYKKVKHDVRT